MNNPLARPFTAASLIKFTLPTVIMMVFMSLYTMVDGVFVSNMIGPAALSAINIVYPAVSIVIALGIMLATGGSAIIARKMGEREDLQARQYFSLLVLTGVLVGVAVAVAGTVWLDPIIRILGATDLLYGYCRDYLFLLALASPLAMLQMLFQFFFVTAGKPKLGLLGTVLGGGLNIVLDYLLIGPLNMGILGAAIGTVAGYAVPALLGLIYFSVNRKGSLWFVRPRFSRAVLVQSCLNGSSEMVTNVATAVTTFLFNIVMLRYVGEDGVAAMTIVLYSQFLLTSLFLGFSSGAAPVFSYNYGVQNHGQLKKLFHISMGVVLTVSAAMFLLPMLFPDPIIRVFVAPESPVFAVAKRGLLLFSISYLFIGLNIFASSMFTALSNGLVSAAISFLRTFLFLIASILLLPMVLGTDGVWLAVPLAELLTLAVSIIFLVRMRKRYHY